MSNNIAANIRKDSLSSKFYLIKKVIHKTLSIKKPEHLIDVPADIYVSKRKQKSRICQVCDIKICLIEKNDYLCRQEYNSI